MRDVILDDLKIGFWKRDGKTGQLTISDFIKNITGMTSNVILISDYLAMIREDCRERIKAAFRVSSPGFMADKTYSLIVPNGEMWVRSKTVDRTSDEAGNIQSIGYMQFIEDPTKETPDVASVLRTNNLLYQLNSISRILLLFLKRDDPDAVIHEMLRDVLKQFKAGRAYIFEYDWENMVQSNTYEVVDDNVEPEIDVLTNYPLQLTSWWTRQVLAGNNIILNELDDLPPEAKDERESLELQHVNSLFIAPLMSKNGAWGYAGVDIVGTYHKWSEADLQWLSAMTNIMSLCIQLSRSEKRALKDKEDLEKLNENLVEAKERAEISDRLKTAFLANMSHEIRTPLNAIVGFSGLLVQSINEEEREMYSKLVQDNNELLLQLFSDILDVSKIEVGTMEITYSDVDINRLCRELLDSYRAKHISNKVKLTFENQLPLCTLTTDKYRLGQILSNLLSNALKFTTQGTISVGYCLTGEKTIRFYVKDTGKGILAGDQKKIFLRFTKLDNFIAGTGLGLAICKGLVELLGGEIGVESEPGRGSCFWFTLPYESRSGDHL